MRRHRHVIARELTAERRRLGERQTALAATADVECAAGPVLGPGQLLLDKVEQVIDVQEVAYLLARSAVAEICGPPSEIMGQHPVAEDSLVRLAHLPWPCDHSAAVDDRQQAVRGCIFRDQVLGSELCGAVE